MSVRRLIAVCAVLVVSSCIDEEPEAVPRSTIAWPSAPSTTTTDVPATPDTTSTSTTALPTTTTEAPRANRVVVGVDFWPQSLNPFVDSSETTLRVTQALHRGLTEIDGGTFEVVPDLAMRVPSVANGLVVGQEEGGITVTFELDPEAVWADGRQVTGDDVAFTYESIMALDAPAFDRSAYEGIVGMTSSETTVSMTFAEPTLAFETMFPVVLPAHVVEGTDLVSDWAEPWMSAGPFRVESLGERELVLVPNDAFPGEGPFLEQLVFRWIPEYSELVDAFGRGEIDVMLPGPNPDAVRRFAGQEGVDVAVGASVIWEHLTFQFGVRNANTATLNSEVDFRRAVAAGLDIRGLLDGLWLSDQAYTSILEMAGVGSDRPWEGREQDPDEAVRLLEGLCTRLERDCAADPPVVVLSTTSNGEARPTVADRIREQLAEVGIEVRLDLQDSALFFGPTLHEGTFDLGLWAWVTTPGRTSLLRTLHLFDPANPLVAGADDRAAGANFGRWGTSALEGQPPITAFGRNTPIELDQGASSVIDEHSERYTGIIEQLRTTADRDRFDELARQAEAILADQVVLIPVVARGHVSVTRGIAGYTPTPWIDTWNVEEWRAS